MPTRRAPLALLAALLVGVGAGVCGGGSDDPGRSARTTPRQPAEPARPARDPLALPPQVPQAATGPADPAAVRVIRRWLATLRRGDTHAAARFFAIPSRFQNGTPVLTVRNQAERIAVNEALPCGARMAHAGGAGAYTIVVYLLVRRPGGDCGSGVGAHARGAVRVACGRITEWYRLPDTPPRRRDAAPATGSAV
jgi:hypothetical protein